MNILYKLCQREESHRSRMVLSYFVHTIQSLLHACLFRVRFQSHSNICFLARESFPTRVVYIIVVPSHCESTPLIPSCHVMSPLIQVEPIFASLLISSPQVATTFHAFMLLVNSFAIRPLKDDHHMHVSFVFMSTSNVRERERKKNCCISSIHV